MATDSSGDGPDDPVIAAILDNFVWHALTGPHASFATGPGPALRYDRSMAVFCATERLDDQGWAALGDLVGPGRAVVLFQPGITTPSEGWTELDRWPTWQMVADGPLRWPEGDDGIGPRPTIEPVELGADDAAEMLALTALTEPGPFFPETYRLGTYLGIREQGRLIAMAGERLRADGVAEISAVCTHPDARRRGLGGHLTMAMAEVMTARGDRPMLHVAKTNRGAIPLYERLGFRIRCEIDGYAARFGSRPD